MRLNLPRAIRQLKLPTSPPGAAVILGLGCAFLISLLVLSHGFPPWRAAWFSPSNAKYTICFTVRPGIDPIIVAERIAGPHPYVSSISASDGYGRKWQCTPIPTSTADGTKALHDAESVLERVRGDSGVAESYLHSAGQEDMFGH